MISSNSSDAWYWSCEPPRLETVRSLKVDGQKCGLVVLAAGFEARARALFDRYWTPKSNARVLLVHYDFDLKANEISYQHIKESIAKSGAADRMVEVCLSPTKPESFEANFRLAVADLALAPGSEIWLDISGLPMWAICAALRGLRSRFGSWCVRVFYTAAKTYFPTREEYTQSLKARGGKGQGNFPASLTSEMSENLILEGFSGVSLREHATCLILFAGYEKHRSLGVIEEINPSLLLLAYGMPAHKQLKWRLEMSQRLHANLITDRPTAEEVVSTLRLRDSLEMLDRYYSILYDDYNICIAPVCSKMQAVAAYVIWERYRDIQLVFPLPVTYLPDRFSEGVEKTFSVRLPPPPGLIGWTAK